MGDERAEWIAEFVSPLRVDKAGIRKKKEGAALLADCQQRLAAQDRYGTIRHVMSGVHPQGVRVTGFEVPSDDELDHDLLRRCNRELPGRGELKPSKDEQRVRSLKRIDVSERNWNFSVSERNWKFSPADVRERARWDDHQIDPRRPEVGDETRRESAEVRRDAAATDTVLTTAGFDGRQMNIAMLVEFALAVLVTRMDGFRRLLGTTRLDLERFGRALVPTVAPPALWEPGKALVRCPPHLTSTPHNTGR
ncbi:hypothetical protein ACH4U3_17565 [Streptomyces griseoruber]|uniref:hypothetical protein n=1 Tax=Streptomyces griseoruber TaxID=1943 RepID=UPI0037B4A48A